MSTLNSILNSSLSSLRADQLALSLAANNIANAQTPGYTRQRLVTAPAVLNEAFPSIGTGVDVVRVQAMRDRRGQCRDPRAPRSSGAASRRGCSGCYRRCNPARAVHRLSVIRRRLKKTRHASAVVQRRRQYRAMPASPDPTRAQYDPCATPAGLARGLRPRAADSHHARYPMRRT